MENYPSYSYPDSGESSPRSREIDFENPPPSWEEQPQQPPPTLPLNHKVKFMVSYGGKIQPRSHDNLLSYVGGETKILAVDRGVKFSSMHSKLASLFSSDADAVSTLSSGFTFKYQLPGEDLDALISVTNDDDLEHMMHEYDRMYRGSSKPARLRLFIFPVQHGSSSTYGSTSSDQGKLDRGPERIDRFVDALNSGPGSVHHEPPVPVPVPVQVPVPTHSGNVDYLFGLDKGPGPVPVQIPVQAPVHVVKSHEPVPEPEIVHELNRLQISAQEHHHQQQQQQQQQAAMYQAKSEESINMVGNFAGDSYQKQPPPGTIPASVQFPAGYWHPVEQQQHAQQPQPPPQQQYHHQHHQQQQQQQPVYMMHAPPQTSMYHAPPVVRPVPGQPGQGGYYQVQRMPQHSDQVYREQPVYSMPAPATAVPGKFSDGMGVPVRPLSGENAGYAQVAYDGATGRQVYYAAPQQPGGVVTAPFQGGSGEMRNSGLTNVEGKVVQKPVPTTAVNN